MAKANSAQRERNPEGLWGASHRQHMAYTNDHHMMWSVPRIPPAKKEQTFSNSASGEAFLHHLWRPTRGGITPLLRKILREFSALLESDPLGMDAMG